MAVRQMSDVRVHGYALVAQLAEQQTFNLMVEGSIPSERTPSFRGKVSNSNVALVEEIII